MFAGIRRGVAIAGATVVALAALTFLPTALHAQAAVSITVTPSTAAPGGTITVTVANGPANALDWVGLFPTSAGDTGYLTWQYLNGAQSVPAGGSAAATLTFTLPAAPGTYNLRFFANNSLTKLATSDTVTALPSLTVTPSTASPGGTITVTVTSGPGHALDWVGLFPTGAGDAGYLTWKYLNGAQSIPAFGRTAATLTFAMPAAAGTYNVRFFASNSFTKLATSATVTTQSSLPPVILTVIPTTASPGGTVTVTVANGLGNARDWVGLFPTSAGDTGYVAWQYLNGQRSAPASGSSAATLTFTLPAAPGTYDVRFFANDSLTKVATSATVTTLPSLAVTPTTASPGGTITVTVANGPGHALDWVGLFPTSAGDAGYLTWQYLNGAQSIPASGRSAATLTFALPAAPGTYNVRFFANNSLTRLATSVAVTATDTTPPLTSITAPAAGATVVGTVTVAASASDNVGVVGVQFQFDGANLGSEDMASPFSVFWNTLGVANGSHTLRTVARDAAGNTATSGEITVTVANDRTSPVISNVTAASTSSGATIGWNTDEVSDSEVEYGLTTGYGGFSTLDVTLRTAHTMALSGLAPNTLYHFRVRSRDVAGNPGVSGDFMFTTLDGTPPEVSILTPTAGATVSGTTVVTATATDSQGIVGVQFQLDGAPLGAADLFIPYSLVWDTTTTTSSTHTLTAVAWDTATNQATSAAVSVTVSNATNQVRLGWDPNPEPDLAGYKVYIGTFSGVYQVTIDVGNVTSYMASGLEAGRRYYFVVTAYNQLGNESYPSNEVTTVP